MQKGEIKTGGTIFVRERKGTPLARMSAKKGKGTKDSFTNTENTAGRGGSSRKALEG